MPTPLENSAPRQVLLIDHNDSFTMTVKSYLQCLHCEVFVLNYDQLTLNTLSEINPSHIVLSPGPGSPAHYPQTQKMIQAYYKKIPMLGICLGHQHLALAFGSEIVQAPEVMHGKTSPLYHHNTGIFKNLEQAFAVTRYHSLIIQSHSLPKTLRCQAWTFDANQQPLIMAIQHSTLPLWGLQFHPEAILSCHGMSLLERFLTSTSPGCLATPT